MACLVSRVLFGMARPELDMGATVAVALATVFLLAPPLYRWIFQDPLIPPGRGQATYLGLTGFAVMALLLYLR